MANCVTYEQALWLKEKGFYLYGYLQDVWLGNKYEWRGKGKNKKAIEIPVFGLGSTSKLPEQHEVIEWLRVKHGIWVYTKPIIDEDGEWIFKGYIKLMNNFKAKEYQTKLCREPQEAYSAAFDYIRTNNLI
jgi:hypothetical protein